MHTYRRTCFHLDASKQSGRPAKVFGISFLFALRSFKLRLIDGGYHAVQFILFGLILGLWH